MSVNEIPSRYNPSDVESKWYAIWEENGYFNADIDEKKEPYTIVIPPPNVTGILHMGHALNNSYQDILIRFNRMKGKNALWMPGTDHAGIATQNVVERKIAKQGKTRYDLGREKFIEEVWKWKEEYGSTIIRQLKRLGASCDWRRLRFTMDDAYSKAVRYVFVKLFEKGLIYQGNYIINWCPRCHTALADEEAPKKESHGKLYYVKYPIAGEKDTFLVVATTRPETILGDSAVAVNPNDERMNKFIGKKVIIPIVNRLVPVIADDFVDPEFGTGAVKITPAHDPDDFLVGKRHNLEAIVVIDSKGIMNENASSYYKMDRFECRKAIVEDLNKMGLIEKIEDYTNNVGHCYRCDTIIEPYLSMQWFVNMKELAKPAIKSAKDGKIKFVPERWKKVYLNWMENIQDWCISRQIWWGHRIPVWYCMKNGERSDCPPIASMETPKKCPKCGNTNLEQDEDVLDTWFSSWLWPFATFYWPDNDEKVKQDLRYFYPTNTLITAPEILFFWVARMIMSGIEFMGEDPFEYVYLHGTVRDDTGRKMSKSLGNIIDPLEIIDEMGADALRFSLISITASGQDVYLSRSKFELGRNFANKIWNASRYILMSVKGKRADIAPANCTLPEKWILTEFNRTCRQVETAIENFRFNEAANKLYDFFWHQFCDWYIEITKINDKLVNKNSDSVLLYILERFLRLLHPFMPFITEEIWQISKEKTLAKGETVMLAPYPKEDDNLIFEDADRFNEIKALITEIRNIRAQIGIKPSQKPEAIIVCKDEFLDVLRDANGLLKFLARLGGIKFVDGLDERPQGAAMIATAKAQVFLLVGDIVDIERQLASIEEQITSLEKEIKKKKGLLSNQGFLKKAPEQIVNSEKEKLEKLNEKLEKLKGLQDAFKVS